jgi:hypothetical protein
VARFIYHEDIQDLGEGRIPVLASLQKRQKQIEDRAKFERSRVPYEEKSLSRDQLLSLIHLLKQLATQEVHRNGKRQLSLGRRALHLQTFLAICFLSLSPPRRYRVLLELELGRTLRRGQRLDKRFIEHTEMSDPQQAQWYYALSSQDYKTGRYQGDCWAPITNWDFGDGSMLYDYIDLWLTDLRPQLNPQGGQFFVNTGLTNSVPGSPVDYPRIQQWIKKATFRYTGVAVTPKEFRKMYVSYIKSLPDITEAELEAIALAMGHSRQMQEQVYNQLGHDETIAPVISFQQRINQSYLENGGGTRQSS